MERIRKATSTSHRMIVPLKILWINPIHAVPALSASTMNPTSTANASAKDQGQNARQRASRLKVLESTNTPARPNMKANNDTTSWAVPAIVGDPTRPAGSISSVGKIPVRIIPTASSLMWSAVRLYSETSGNSKAMAAKNAHPTMATVAISLSRRGSTRIVDADTVLPSLGNSLPALLNDTHTRTNVHLSRVYSPKLIEESL